MQFVPVILRALSSPAGICAVITIALVLTVTFAGQAFGAGRQIRLLAVFWIALVGILTALILARRQRKVQSKSGPIQASQTNSSSHKERDARGACRRELRAISAAMRKSKLVGSSAPWYLVIGASGAGKSAAIRASGLEGAHASIETAAELGARRVCDWWFTDQGVFLEVSCRFIEPGSAELRVTEWEAFLTELRKLRPDVGLQGVIVVQEPDEFRHLRLEVLEERALAIRSCLDGVARILRLEVPVYLFTTKMDLVAGFSESFAGIPDAARNQIWGATLDPATGAAAPPEELLSREFAILSHALIRRRLVQLVRVEQVERRTSIYQFPAEFAKLRERLSLYARLLCGPDMYGDQHTLRGFYFGSSGVRSAAPGIAGSSGADELGSATREAQSGESTSRDQVAAHFTKSFFVDVLIPDFELSRPKAIDARRSHLLQTILRAAALAFICAMAAWMISSFVGNRALLIDSQNCLRAVRAAESERVTNAEAWTALCNYDNVGNLVERFWRLEGHPFQYSGGWLYQSWAARRREVEQVYLAGVQRTLFGPCLQGIKATLDEPTTSCGDFLVNFQAYMAIVDPWSGEVSTSGASEDNILLSAAKKPWGRRTRDIHGHDVNELVERHLKVLHTKQYAKWRGSQAKLVGAEHNRYVGRYGECLGESPVVSDLYTKMIAEASRMAPSFPTAGDLPNGLIDIPDGLSIPGAFSRDGWEKYVKRYLSDLEENGPSERGLREFAGRRAFASAEGVLREKYYFDYSRRWREMLGAATFHEQSGLSATADAIEKMANARSDLSVLLRRAHENTSIAEIAPSIATGTDQRNLEKDFGALHRFFSESDSGSGERASPVTEYWVRLGRVAAAVAAEKDQQSGNELTHFVEQHCAPIEGREDQECTQALRYVLMMPLRRGSEARINDRVQQLNDQWREKVYQEYQEMIAGRYPFAAGARAEVAPEDFEAFFGPRGIVAQFERDYIDAEQRQHVGPKTKNALTRTTDIREAMFRTSSALEFGYSVSPKSISSPGSQLSTRIDKAVFEVGKTFVANTNGTPIPKQFTWSGNEESAMVSVPGDAGIAPIEVGPGAWAVFRLVDKARPAESANPGALCFVWSFNSGAERLEVSFEITPRKSANPFGQRFFSFSCPERLTD